MGQAAEQTTLRVINKKYGTTPVVASIDVSLYGGQPAKPSALSCRNLFEVGRIKQQRAQLPQFVELELPGFLGHWLRLSWEPCDCRFANKLSTSPCNSSTFTMTKP